MSTGGIGPQPKHLALREYLIGLARPGEAIPSERELMASQRVSRATVRKAIDGLVADGLLRRVQGLGTFAVQPRLETRLHLASFSQDMARRGKTPSTRLVLLAEEEPPQQVLDALRLAAGERAWHVVRVRLADSRPMAHEDGWYPAGLFPALGRRDLAAGSLYQVLGTDYDRWIDRAEQELWAEAADPDLAEALAAPVGTPLLAFRRTSYAAGLPVERVISRYRGDRYQLQMDLSRDDPA
ncbi:MAG: GntR family transcriptional regulator [Propionicimonas sp.]